MSSTTMENFDQSCGPNQLVYRITDPNALDTVLDDMARLVYGCTFQKHNDHANQENEPEAMINPELAELARQHDQIKLDLYINDECQSAFKAHQTTYTTWAKDKSRGGEGEHAWVNRTRLTKVLIQGVLRHATRMLQQLPGTKSTFSFDFVN